MSQLSRAIAGGSLLTGILAIFSILIRATPAIDTLKDYKDALDIYAKYVRTPMARSLSLDATHYLSYGLDIVILWCALFAAINAFVQRDDGLFVWGHIARCYCFKEKQTFLAQTRCVVPKLLIAFLAAPIVCTIATWSRVTTGEPSITMAYMTVDPKIVARYLCALFGVPALIIVALSFLAQWFNF
jgi:hypothetical protein